MSQVKRTPVLALLALGLVATGCESTGDSSFGQALGEAMAGMGTEQEGDSGAGGLTTPVGLNPDQQVMLDLIGATRGPVYGTSDYLARALGADQQIEAVKKARSYQESIEKKGKSKEVASVIKETGSVYAVPVSGDADAGQTQLVLIDPTTNQPVDGKVYTVPAVADNTLIQVGTVKALFTTGAR